MMKRKAMIFILAAVVAALAALLLAGCQNRSNKENSQTISKEKEIHMPAPIDTSQMDEEFYRRMREFPESPSDK